MKHLLIRSALFIILAVGAINLYAQSLPDTIVSYFRLVQSLPQEKLHLHLDKPYYAAGDTIWFKGYLQNAITHHNSIYSNFIIVELINPKDSIISQKKVRRRSDGFAALFHLPVNLQSGNYHLRGYSNWMLNAGEEFLFSHSVRIENSINTALDSFTVAQVEKPDYDVTFFPEGGELLSGVPQVVAFKALGANGLSTSVEGKIVDAAGNVAVTFHTQHAGMGRFVFAPSDGVTYHAEVISTDGLARRFPLPAVRELGIGLSLTRFRNDIHYAVRLSPTTPLPDELYLVAHTRGMLRLVKRLTAETLSGVVGSSYFNEGITHFLLVNGQGVPLSERLIFVYPHQVPTWEVKTDRSQYAKRERVSLHLSAFDGEGRPLSGDFSVSITDAGCLKPDPHNSNILSRLLLTSDLKGYIEAPGYYFADDNKQRESHLDLLMLTQGWRRFIINYLTEHPAISDEHYVEQGQTISGQLLKLTKRKKKANTVSVYSPQRNIYRQAEIDNTGRFLVDNISFPEGTQFIIQSDLDKYLTWDDIRLDSVYHPVPSYTDRPNMSVIQPVDTAYREHVRQRFYYEDGMRMVDMDEVVVSANRKNKDEERVVINSLKSISVTGDDIQEKHTGLTLDQILEQYTNTSGMIVVVDGFTYGRNIFDTFHVNDIKRVDILKGASAMVMYGQEANVGAIVIEMKRGADDLATARKNHRPVLTFTPLGYSIDTEFYHPTYETPESKRTAKPDLRTTLYWNPSLRFDDRGAALIEYYNADFSHIHRIEIEGVDQSGKVYRYSKLLPFDID